MKTIAKMNEANFISKQQILTDLFMGFKFNDKGKSFFKLFLSLLFLLNLTFSFAQSNKAVFKVQNDRTSRSTSSKGTYYKMELTNSGQSDTFDLSYVNVNDKSTNPDGSSVKDNVTLKVIFMTKDLRPVTQLKINSGETVNFFAYIEVPNGTPSDKWSSNKVIASSRLNSNYKVDTVLHTVVLNSIDN